MNYTRMHYEVIAVRWSDMENCRSITIIGCGDLVWDTSAKQGV